MSLLLYNIFLLLYRAGIGCYSLFNSKAKKWIEGRKQWPLKMAAALHPEEKRIWFHCSSLGEFEQGRPLIESLKQKYPHYKIVITFFSPSGYEVQKNYANADYVFYMPLDNKSNAKRFIKLINPSLAVFVKYEFWYYYLEELHTKKFPQLLFPQHSEKNKLFFHGMENYSAAYCIASIGFLCRMNNQKNYWKKLVLIKMFPSPEIPVTTGFQPLQKIKKICQLQKNLKTIINC